MSDIADIAQLGFSVDSSGLVKGEKALTRLDDAGNRVVDTSKVMTASLKAAAVGVTALAAATVSGINKYKQYGTALAEVNTLLDSSWDTGSLENLSEGVRNLTKQMGGDVVRNTKALYQVISAGASDSAEAIETLTQANKLAIGGVASIEGAVDGLTSSLNAYAKEGLSAADASDSMFIAVKKGKTTIEELSGVMGSAAPLAAAVGVSFDEMNAAIATITTTGASTSEAATGLVGVMKTLIKPTKEAADLAKELGINLSATALENQTFAEFIEDIAIKTDGSADKLGKLFGEVEGLKAVMQLGGDQADTFASIIEAMGQKSGATELALAKMTTGTARLGFEWEKIKSKASDALIVLGERASNVLLSLLDNTHKISEGLVLATKAVASFAAGVLGMRVIPPILAAISTQAAFASNTIALVGVRGAASVASMNLLAVATTGLSRAFALMGGPIGLAIIAFTSIAMSATEAEAQSSRLSQSLQTLGVSGLDPATAKTEALANEMRELNLITAQNNLLSLKTSLTENQREIDAAVIGIAQLKKGLELDNLSNDFIRGASAEISILEGNLTKAEQVQRLLNVQIGQGKGEVQGMKLAVAGLSEVTVTATSTAEHFAEATAQSSVAANKLGDSVSKIISAEKDREQAIKELNSAILQGKDYNGVLADELGRLTGATKKLVDEERERTKELEDQKRAAEELARATGTDLLKSQEELNKALDQGTLKTANYEKALEQAKLAILSRGGIVEGTKEWDKALEDLGFRVDKTSEKATAMGALWERTTDSMFDTGQTFFRSALDGWDGFKSGADNAFDSIKNAFKDLIASLLAQWVTSGIVGLFSGDGFSGFSLNNAFGSGSNGGSLGGLFGGNSSGQSQGGLIQTGAETLGNQFGLTSQQSQDILSGVASAYTIYNGYNQIKNGNAIGGGVQLAGGGVDAYNTIQRLLGGEELSGNISGGIGLAGNAFGIYNGIKQGGVAGYGQAGVSGLQAFNTLKDLGLIGNAAGASAEFAGLADYYNSTFGTANAVASGVDGVNTVNATTSGSSTLGTASTALGVAAGAYNIYGGLKEGGTAGYGQAAGGAITAASSLGYLSALGPYGAAIGAVISILAGTGGARTPQELGLDQLEEVDQATKAGRNENVALGQAAGKSVSFIGGFDENSTFFGADLGIEKLQQVGDKLERFGIDQALALKDGIIRLEDKDRNFSENNERIVSEVKSAIVEVELSITELERTTIGSLGGAVIEVDALFDSMRDNGKSSADNLASAFAEAFDTTIEAGHDWVNSTAIDADRIAEIFDNSSAGVSEALFGVSADGIKAFEDLSLGAINQVGMISGSIGNLGTAANDAFLLMQGGLNDIQGSAQAASRQFIESQNNLRVVQGDNDQRQSDNSNEASQQQAETNDILARTAKALEDTAPFIRQAAARAASGQ